MESLNRPQGATVKEYIIECIEVSSFIDNPKMRVHQLFMAFKVDTEWKVGEPGLIKELVDWLISAPWILKIAYSDRDIIQLAKKYKVIPVNACNTLEFAARVKYWDFIANEIGDLFYEYRLV